MGSNGVLELDFAISRTGQLDPAHTARYKQLGAWISSCYGTPVARTSGSGQTLELTVPPAANNTIDRMWIREDLQHGQRIRNFTVEYMAAGSESWTPFSAGRSVGNKRIDLLSAPAHVSKLRLTVTAAIADPMILDFAVFAPCPSA